MNSFTKTCLFQTSSWKWDRRPCRSGRSSWWSWCRPLSWCPDQGPSWQWFVPLFLCWPFCQKKYYDNDIGPTWWQCSSCLLLFSPSSSWGRSAQCPARKHWRQTTCTPPSPPPLVHQQHKKTFSEAPDIRSLNCHLVSNEFCTDCNKGRLPKKKRENVWIFPNQGPPPCLGIFSRFYRLFLGGLPC